MPGCWGAIATHTLGSPDMDAIGAVVYLADALEPGRGDTPQLEHLRELSYGDLWGAVYETCVFSLQHLLANQRLVHPRTILTHNQFFVGSPSAIARPISSVNPSAPKTLCFDDF